LSFSAGTTSAALNSLVLSNSNNATFGLNGSTVTVSAPLKVSAGTLSNQLTDITFANTGNINWGLNGSTVTADNVPISSYENLPFIAGTSQSFAAGSVSIGVAFQLPMPISASFIRIPAFFNNNSSSISTLLASLNASAERYSTWNAVVYSLATGASSRSLVSVASGSAGATFRNSLSVATNGTHWTATQQLTMPVEGGSTTASTSNAVSAAAYNFSNNYFSDYSGSKFLDIPFNNSLSAGPYWLIVGVTTGSATNDARVAFGTTVGPGYASHTVVSQHGNNWRIMGSTNATSGGLFGCGSFSKAGGGTTSALPMSAISSSASHNRLYFQMLRSA
jgi:hypothetical protein